MKNYTMHKLKFCLCLLCFFDGNVVFAQGIPLRNEGAPSTTIDALRSVLARNDIDSIEVFRLPKGLRSFSAIGPEGVENGWYYKLAIRVRSEQPELINKALKSTTIMPWDRIGDLRWGFVFYSARDHKRVTALYFDETGRYGSVAGGWVSYGVDLASQLQKALGFSIP